MGNKALPLDNQISFLEAILTNRWRELFDPVEIRLAESTILDQPNSFEFECRKVCSELAELVIGKQHDYGKANILDFGETGILIRSNDKFARLKNLIMNKKEPSNESVTDTWKDVAGYAVLALMLRNDTFKLPMEEKK